MLSSSSVTALSSAQPVGRAARRPGGFVARLWAALALRRQRAHLAELPDDLLDDIGLTREQARHEAARPLWDAPGHWYR